MNISPVPCAPRPQYFFGVQLCCPSHYQGKSSDLWALIRPGLCGFWPRPDPETHLQVQRPWNQNRQGPHFGIIRYFVQTDLILNIWLVNVTHPHELTCFQWGPPLPSTCPWPFASHHGESEIRPPFCPAPPATSCWPWQLRQVSPCRGPLSHAVSPTASWWIWSGTSRHPKKFNIGDKSLKLHAKKVATGYVHILAFLLCFTTLVMVPQHKKKS